MGRWRQIRQLLGQRTYRIRVAFFFLVSVVLFLTSLLMVSPVWKEILLEFAVTFGAVGLLQLLWDFLGGEPLELHIDELKDEVRRIQSSVGILSDLADGNIGLERIWPDRQSWQWDTQDGLSVWHDRVCHAKKVDIVSNTLWTNWMMNPKFRQDLFEHIAHGAQVRILVYEPGSLVQRLRAADEVGGRISTKAMIQTTLLRLTEDEKDVPDSMGAEIEAMLLALGDYEKDMPGDMEKETQDTFKLARNWEEALPASARKNLQVGLTRSSVHPAQIIRADDRMLVATYLSGKGGSPSPTMQLRGTGSLYFQKYEEQFTILWERAEILDETQLEQVLGEVDALPRPPTVE